ncbi:hypothetical protein BJY24_005944 [Nocardia transvalensis]|uniref:Uncharacterized protein n=1 Tax=Nocardia transvalensis TaxID=37333 RepID=A0A7W9PIY6_9NOCA|nr:hypothetical protein [Nocardia transvalensis]MBB5917032.1 hypothetical protein [Nocardia transvalensis]
MPATPNWVRRNRAVAWSTYFCVLIAFATLAMALTAAGSGHTDLAVLAGGVCAATVIVGLTLVATTVHRDHEDHHAVPNLLNDHWRPMPSERREGRPAPIAARRMRS